MLSLMNYNVRNLKEQVSFVDVYVGGQIVVANVPVKELNIKLISKSETGEFIGESLVYKEFEHLKEEEQELLLNERNNDSGCW